MMYWTGREVERDVTVDTLQQRIFVEIPCCNVFIHRCKMFGVSFSE